MRLTICDNMPKQTKIFYTSSMGQGSAEFTLVQDYTGRGVYIGKRKLADDKELALYHEQLLADRMTIPEGTSYVTVMRPFVMGDLINDGPDLAKSLYATIENHMDADFNRRKAVVCERVCYVGTDFAGRLDKIRPLLNAFDREIIRHKLADALLNNLPVNSRYVFDRYQLQRLRELRG